MKSFINGTAGGDSITNYGTGNGEITAVRRRTRSIPAAAASRSTPAGGYTITVYAGNNEIYGGAGVDTIDATTATTGCRPAAVRPRPTPSTAAPATTGSWPATAQVPPTRLWRLRHGEDLRRYRHNYSTADGGSTTFMAGRAPTTFTAMASTTCSSAGLARAHELHRARRPHTGLMPASRSKTVNTYDSIWSVRPRGYPGRWPRTATATGKQDDQAVDPVYLAGRLVDVHVFRFLAPPGRGATATPKAVYVTWDTSGRVA